MEVNELSDDEDGIPEDACFVDFAAEKKRSGVQISSPHFWAEKVMLSWAQLEYSHGLAIKKWAETQKANLRGIEEGCPEALKETLEVMIAHAECKSAICTDFYQQIESDKGVKNGLARFDLRHYRPTMERISREMKELVSSQKSREVRTKKEEKRYQDSMRRIRDRERSVADIHHTQGRTDVAIARLSECQSDAVTALDRYIVTMRDERSQRREFIRYANHLQEVWTRKQRERLALLVSGIQTFVKDIRIHEAELNANSPVKQLTELLKKVDVDAIVKEMESNSAKVYVFPENNTYAVQTYTGKLLDNLRAQHQALVPPTTPERRSPFKEHIDLISVPKALVVAEAFPKPLNLNFHGQPPQIEESELLVTRPQSTIERPILKKNAPVQCISRQRRLLTPAMVDMAARTYQPPEAGRVSPMGPVPSMEDTNKLYRGDEEEEEDNDKEDNSERSSVDESEKATEESSDFPQLPNKTPSLLYKHEVKKEWKVPPIVRPSSPENSLVTALQKHREGSFAKALETCKHGPAATSMSQDVNITARPEPILPPPKLSRDCTRAVMSSSKCTVDAILRNHYGLLGKIDLSASGERSVRRPYIPKKQSRNKFIFK